MGIFKTAANRLSTFFNGAPAAEVKRVNTALRGIEADLIVADEAAPKARAGYRPNRADRRAATKGKRLRDRNTAFSKRSKALTPRQLHKTTTDKWVQVYSHGLLGALMARGGYNVAEEGGAA